MTRRLFHQIHLWLSLPLGILFAVICLTGAILVFENEALQLLNPQADVSSMRKHDPARRELTGYGRKASGRWGRRSWATARWR